MAGGEHRSRVTEPLCGRAGSIFIAKKESGKQASERNSTFLNRKDVGTWLVSLRLINL